MGFMSIQDGCNYWPDDGTKFRFNAPFKAYIKQRYLLLFTKKVEIEFGFSYFEHPRTCNMAICFYIGNRYIVPKKLIKTVQPIRYHGIEDENGNIYYFSHNDFMSAMGGMTLDETVNNMQRRFA